MRQLSYKFILNKNVERFIIKKLLSYPYPDLDSDREKTIIKQIRILRVGAKNIIFGLLYLLRGLRLAVARSRKWRVQRHLRLGARLVRVDDHGLHVVQLLVLLVLPVYRSVMELLLLLLRLLLQQVPGRRPFVRLTVIQTAVATYLHLAPDVHAKRVRKLECVEERVRDHGRPFVRSPSLQEPTDHFRP